MLHSVADIASASDFGTSPYGSKLYVGADAVGMISELLTASMNTNMHVSPVTSLLSL